ncbi:MAG: integrase core domain-containing protein [Patescibacteria group bacterium]
MAQTRNLKDYLIAMKKGILDKCINKQMKCYAGAKLLRMHPKSFSRLKKLYLWRGEAALFPKKTGPKKGSPPNRTSGHLEYLVCETAKLNPRATIIAIADYFNGLNIKIHPTTVYRILKRNRIRYCLEYSRLPKAKPTLYCLETPGLELQMDACYPFGRGRKIACFDAIDDCSRLVIAKLYDRETAANAIDFVKYLVAKAPFRIQRIRVDNRYGHELRDYCKTIGIEVVTIHAHRPQENGKIERFHKTLKEQFFWRYCGFYDDTELLQYRLNRWLAEYNDHRKHYGFGMSGLTPRQKLAGSLFNSLCIIQKEKVTLTLQTYII